MTDALLVAMSTGTATAKRPGSGKRSGKGQSKSPATVTYVFKGQMASVTEDGSSFEIALTDGNKAGRSAVASGELLSITVTPETNDQEATMADLQAGDDVVVQSKGHKGDTSFTARMISAPADLEGAV